MNHRFIHLVLAAISVALPPRALSQATPSRAVIDPFPIRFTRGDSATVSVTLVDSIGGEITGVPWEFRTGGRVVGSRTEGRHVVLTADRPVTQVFYVTVNSKDIDSVTVTVTDYAIKSVVIQDLEFAPYVGTTFRLKAKVLTDKGTESDAKVVWRTDDPCHARVMPDGVITFAEAGKIEVVARVEGISVKKEINIVANPVATVDVSPRSAQTRVGDKLTLRISASDRRGVNVDRVAFTFAVHSVDSAGGEIVDDGDFIAEAPGTYVVRVSAGDPTAEAVLEVGPRPPATAVSLIGRGAMGLGGTRALAIFTGKDARDYAYAGTRAKTGSARLYVWDVTDAARPVLTDSLSVSGTAVTDVQVNGDGSWAVLGREPSSGGRGGLTILDLTAPAHPTVAAEVSEGIAGGIRGVWIPGPISLVYAADATTGGMVIFDLSNPRAPRFVTGVDATPGRIAEIHDVWADNKHAFLAAGEGLIVLDVGDKGSPTVPRMLTTLTWPRASARTVTRAGRYVFVGEALEGCDACVSGPRGRVRVVDVRDPDKPRQVANFAVPETGTGGVWVDNNVLYAATYQGGLRIVDVSGELAHDLYNQGRQAGWYSTPDRALVVGTQTYKGLVYILDANGGFWILSHQRAARIGS